MTESSPLKLRIDYKDNGAGYLVGWLTDGAGRVRKATAEECLLWDALQDSLAQPSAPEETLILTRQPARRSR